MHPVCVAGKSTRLAPYLSLGIDPDNSLVYLQILADTRDGIFPRAPRGSVAAPRLQAPAVSRAVLCAISSRMPLGGPSETPAPPPTASSAQEDVLRSFDLHLLDECLPRPQDGPPPPPAGAQAILGDGLPSGGCHWLPWSDPSPSFGRQSGDSPAAARCPWPPAEWSPRGADALRLAGLAIGSGACEDAPPAGAAPGGAQQILLPRWSQCRAEGRQPAYEWPPQSEPELERRRRRAVRAFRSRQRASQRELATREQMTCMAGVIGRLQAENAALKRKIALLESQLEVQSQEQMERSGDNAIAVLWI